MTAPIAAKLTLLEPAFRPLMCHFDASVAAYPKISPALLAAICWRETWFGTAPGYDRVTCLGDGGHGCGLMQIDNRAHGNWTRTHNFKDPKTNIQQGADILQECFRWFKQKRLDALLPGAAVAAYNAGIGAVFSAILEKRLVDDATTGKDYSAWVLQAVPLLVPYFTGEKP